MSATPSISIIVPVYNVEPYLRHCLDSLVGQTLREIEIICVDDGSTDASPTILADYAAKDERIRVLTQANAGLSAARNSGLGIARAPYIMFCDSDDWYAQEMCWKMLKCMKEHPSAEVAICGYHSEWEREREDNEPDGWMERLPLAGFHALTTSLIRKCYLVVWNKIYKREIIEKYVIRLPDGVHYEDCYFWYVYASRVKNIVFHPEQLYYYRQRASSIMSNAYKKDVAQNVDYIRVALLIWNYFHANGFQNLWGGYIAEMIGEQIRNALRYSTESDVRSSIIPRVREFAIYESQKDNGRVSPLLFRALLASLLQPIAREKYLGGLLYFRYTLSQTTIRLCGMPLIRLRFREDSLTWYVLGIPFRRVKGSSSSLLSQYVELLYRPFIPLVNSQYSLSLIVSHDGRECYLIT